jgi:hypothetical protein
MISGYIGQPTTQMIPEGGPIKTSWRDQRLTNPALLLSDQCIDPPSPFLGMILLWPARV